MELSTQAKGKASKIIDKTTHVDTLSALLVRLQNDNEVLFDTTFIITVYDEKGKADNKKRYEEKSGNSVLPQTKCSGGKWTHILRVNLRYTTP